MFTPNEGIVQRTLFDVRANMSKRAHLSRVLDRNVGLKRVEFDPENDEHRLIFTRFLMGGGWQGGVTFYIEAPHQTVPSTVINKILAHSLRTEMAVVLEETKVGEVDEILPTVFTKPSAIEAPPLTEADLLYSSAP